MSLATSAVLLMASRQASMGVSGCISLDVWLVLAHQKWCVSCCLCWLCVCVCFGTRSAAVGMVVGFARLLSYAMVWHADSRGEDWVRKGKGGASCFVAVNTLSQLESGLLSAYA